MTLLVDTINEAGQRICLEAEELLNRRGRVLRVALRVKQDEKTVYTGDDWTIAQEQVATLLTVTSEPKKRKRAKDGDA